MERFLKWDYSFIHTWSERDKLIDIKSWKFSLDEAKHMADNYVKSSEMILNNYSHVDTYDAKEKMITFSRDLIYNNIISLIKQ